MRYQKSLCSQYRWVCQYVACHLDSVQMQYQRYSQEHCNRHRFPSTRQKTCQLTQSSLFRGPRTYPDRFESFVVLGSQPRSSSAIITRSTSAAEKDFNNSCLAFSPLAAFRVVIMTFKTFDCSKIPFSVLITVFPRQLPINFRFKLMNMANDTHSLTQAKPIPRLLPVTIAISSFISIYVPFINSNISSDYRTSLIWLPLAAAIWIYSLGRRLIL